MPDDKKKNDSHLRGREKGGVKEGRESKGSSCKREVTEKKGGLHEGRLKGASRRKGGGLFFEGKLGSQKTRGSRGASRKTNRGRRDEFDLRPGRGSKPGGKGSAGRGKKTSRGGGSSKSSWALSIGVWRRGRLSSDEVEV